MDAAVGDVKQTEFAVKAGRGGHSAVAQVVGDAGYSGVQQRQAAGLVGNDGDFALGVILGYVHIGEALGGERAGDAVYIEGDDVFLHSLAVQFRVAPAVDGVDAAQGPLAGADEGSGAAGGVHEVQLGYLVAAQVLKGLGGQGGQQFGDFRFGVVGGAFLAVAHQPLPQFAGEVVDVLGL